MTPEEKLAIAEYGIEVGELATATDVLRFFESPRKYTVLRDDYREDQARAELVRLGAFSDV